MIRWLRFLLCAGLVCGTVFAHRGAIHATMRALGSASTFAPQIPSPPLVLGLLGLAIAYSIWLSGSMLAGWRMPLVTQVVPFGFFAWLVLVGPLEAPADRFAGLGPADRAHRAMLTLAAGLEKRAGSACSLERSTLERALNGADVPPPGYRAHGRLIDYAVEAISGLSSPVRDLRPGAKAGTLYLACDREGRRFWLTAVIAGEHGEPALALDGVGKVASVVGEVGR